MPCPRCGAKILPDSLFCTACGAKIEIPCTACQARNPSDARFCRKCGAAADTELFERYVASGAEGMPQGAIEFLRGWNVHDLVRARAGLCDDFVLDDHRRTGMGRLEGADAYIAAVAALRELIPNARSDVLYNLGVARHDRVSVNRTAGANIQGGAVESLFVVLSLYRDEKLARFELFELEHLDAAHARFEELRPNSSDTTLAP